MRRRQTILPPIGIFPIRSRELSIAVQVRLIVGVVIIIVGGIPMVECFTLDRRKELQIRATIIFSWRVN